MNYGSVAGVRSLVQSMGQALSDTDPQSRPTAADVTTWLTELEAEVDNAYALSGFTVPITDANLKLKLGRRINRRGAYDVMVARGVARTKDDEPLWLDWKQEFDDMLAGIPKGEWSPPSSSTPSGMLPWSPTMDADHTPSDDGLNPRFDKDMDL